jgi:multimeric flavodoxin WrbA
MKNFIINGSPRKNGDTAFLLSKFKAYIDHEVKEISAYYDNISPCIDCRACQKKKGCVIKDKMCMIYEDDFDNIIIASPLYMSSFTPPLMGIASRFQSYYCAKRFLKDEFNPKKKNAALIIVGGGEGGPEAAIKLSAWIFKKLNAVLHEEHIALSLKTDDIPSGQDENAVKRVEVIARYFNGNNSKA